MRGILLFTIFLFIAPRLYGQLSVKPSEKGGVDHFVFVSDALLYVDQELQLTKNPSAGAHASIYLRKNAQLIQGKDQKIPNSGTGSISIFQRGTANAYDYNYWSAPVTAPENGFFGTSLLHAPASALISHPAQQSSALTGSANPLSIATSWIYTFTGTTYSNWNFIGSSTSIAPGLGFTMKGTQGKDPTHVDGSANNSGNAQRYDFRGKPNSGIIEVPVTAGNFVLIGNPYPSAFDLSLFLLENSGRGTLKTHCYGDLSRKNVTTGIAYFWDSKEDGDSHYLEDYVGGYGAFSPVDPCTAGIYEAPVLRKIGSGSEHGRGRNFNHRILPVGQGFMVQASEGGNITFRNSQRTYVPVEKLNPGKKYEAVHKKHFSGEEPVELPRIHLVISVTDTYERRLSMAFWEEATPGVDVGMDAAAFDVAPTDAGWLHEDQNYIIDVRPFDITEEIPLFLQVDNRYPKMTFSQGISENDHYNNLFILDTQTNKYFSIKEDALTLELQPGTYHGRFKLAFAEKVPQEMLPQVFFEDAATPVKFDIHQNNLLGALEIIGNDVFPVKAVGIFDLQGKRILYRTNFDNRRSVSIATGHWANAVYIVKVTGMDNQKTIKKISVYNK